jgi:hypothetical protein
VAGKTDAPDDLGEKPGRIPIPGLAMKGVRISELALMLMLLGILAPAAFYAYRLHDPTPTALLVAICISLFSSVVFLWILDSTSILRFRSEWVSRSVWGAAIVSVLGTSVAVYKDAFVARPYPYQGRWELAVSDPASNKLIANHTVAMTFSDSAGEYWGYSEFNPSSGDKAAWVEIMSFLPQDGSLTLRLLSQNGNESVIHTQLVAIRPEKLLKSKPSDKYLIELSRGK